MEMCKNTEFNANLYAAYIKGKTNKEENRKVLSKMISNPRLILELNLASVACKSNQLSGKPN